VKEIRVVLLAFFTLITARMMGELPACPGNLISLCGFGLLVIIPFLLSTYFLDSMMETLASSEDKKEKIMSVVFCVPYIVLSAFVIKEFLVSASIVTLEYVLGLNTIYAAIIYVVFYVINNQKLARKVNIIFMVTLLLSALIFSFL